MDDTRRTTDAPMTATATGPTTTTDTPRRSDIPRWIIVVLALLVLVGLVAYARGRDHHRGDDVGERAVPAVDAVALDGPR